MKNTLLVSASALILALLGSCGGENKQNTEATEEKAPLVCAYTYDASQTTLNWTAYKFTEKLGVKGSFDTVQISGSGSGTIAELLAGAMVNIPVSSINSANPDRDAKIQKFFFGSLKGTTQLTGKVDQVNGNDSAGTLSFVLKMNEMESPVSMSYVMSGDTLIISGGIDVNNWNAQAGISGLNKACEVLHKGADGKSALWPDVNLEIRSVLKKTCE